MKKVLLVLLIVAIVLPLTALGQKNSFGEIKQLQSPQDPRLGFIIHGGAGVISKAAMTPETEKQFRAKLEESLIAGYKALQAGSESWRIRRCLMPERERYLQMTAKMNLTLR